MTDMTTLADGRTVTWRTDATVSPATVVFRVADADGTILIDQAAITPTGSNPRISVVGVEGLADGGLRVIYHEELFIQFDDGSIYSQVFSASGEASTPTLVSEQFHLMPQTRPSIETLSDGTFLYAQDSLFAPDPDAGWNAQIVYPVSFNDRLFPYAQAITETDAGFAWATMSLSPPLNDTPVLLHLFNADLSRVAVKVPVGSTLHEANSDFSARVYAVDVDTLDDGRIAVVWATERFADETRTGDPQSGIFLAIHNPNGTVSVPEMVVSPTANALQVFEMPRVFALDGGGYAVAFQGRQQGNSTLSAALHIQTYDASGQLLDEDIDPRTGTSPLRGLTTQDLVISADGSSFALTVDSLVSLDDREGAGSPPDLPTEGADDLLGTAGPDSVTLLGGNDTYSGGDGDDLANGGTGDDSLYGNTGNDTLLGGEGDDRLDGGNGDDSLAGADGADTLLGGKGYDTLRGGDGNDRVVGGDGRDLAYLGGGDDLFFDNAQGGVNGRDTVWANAGNDTVQGGNGDDVFYGEGGADLILGRLGNDRLFGGDQNDTLRGGDGNDVVAGGNGRDRAFLGAGNDQWFDNDQVQFGDDFIDGWTGDDTIRMGGGNDTAVGGAGADTFVFAASIDADVIRDYQLGQDALQIDTGLWGGALDLARLEALTDTSSGTLVLDFGGGHSITFEGLTSNAGLLDDIVLV
ncbi:calcium-binding protein [Thetidibacter halocola]|uniref:Calcium-binding protein n=1 Tax=Thetidibacter halocola TaxID=2827239 RepID=A0A8J8BAP4_9RHOB|nr:calcium-binding protein [Thetidibacter halocola]MBS0126795.1 hypothetical protein [Thetidibacter halocola]